MPGFAFILRRRSTTIIHVAVWLYIFLSPVIFMPNDRPFDLIHDAGQFILPFFWFIVFYANYFWLVPHYFQKKKYVRFALFTILMLSILLMVEPLLELSFPELFSPPPPPIEGRHVHTYTESNTLSVLKILMHDSIMYVLSALAAIYARVARKWQDVEQDLHIAKLQMTEAEIKNLKYQINPHFLLNVLNNIYALVAIDQEKAQAAIVQLSKMMRYLLSNFDTPTIPLNHEMEFIETYVNLMRIRITKNVDLKFNVDVPADNSMEIAPMILISLVENAFKHGISSVEDSFIHINIKARHNKLHITCSNSNFPKTGDDKTPNGVGLKLMVRRLELSYPDNFAYQTNISEDGKVFTTTIDINLIKIE